MKFADDVWRFTHDHWPLLAPVLLGFLAVYWLLPSVRRSWLVPGIVVGAVALVSAGWLLIYQQFATVEAVLFYAFSGPAVLGGVLMLAQHNPVRAALAFALVVLSTCGLFLLLAAPFLMAATIIIYAGAIIITFLFVVMLAQQSGAAGADMRAREPFLASLAGFVLLAGLLVVLQRNYDTRGLDAIIDKVQAVVSATSPEEVRQALGEPKQNNLGNWPFKSDGPALDDEEDPAVKALLKAQYANVARSVGNVEHAWTAFRSAKKTEEQTKLQAQLQEKCAVLLAELRAARAGQGSLEPEERLKVNTPGAVPRNVLPARNVEAVGKTLFSDYLIAVEEAGLLLLVATIGAIVIAQRRDPVLGKAAKGGAAVVTPLALENYLVVGAILFVLGMIGFLARRNLIIMFLSAEMMMQGVALNLLAFSRFRGNLGGQALTLFMLAVAACEAALALTIILMLYRRRRSLDVSLWQELREPGVEETVDEEPLPAPPVEPPLPHLTPAGPQPALPKELALRQEESSHV